MKTLKKTLCLVLAVVMAVGVLVLPASAAETADDYVDSAQISKEYTAAVNIMTMLGVLNGKVGETFDPTGILTRGESAKIIAYVNLGSDVAKSMDGTNAFADVTGKEWYAGYVSYSKDRGIIAGKDGNRFDGDGQLTGVEYAKMLLVSLGFGIRRDPFTGAITNNPYVGANWSNNVIVAATNTGILDGMKAGFDIKAPLNREAAAQMTLNAAKFTQPTGEYVTKTENGVTYRTEVYTVPILESVFHMTVDPYCHAADGTPYVGWYLNGVLKYADYGVYQKKAESENGLTQTLVNTYDLDETIKYSNLTVRNTRIWYNGIPVSERGRDLDDFFVCAKDKDFTAVNGLEVELYYIDEHVRAFNTVPESWHNHYFVGNANFYDLVINEASLGQVTDIKEAKNGKPASIVIKTWIHSNTLHSDTARVLTATVEEGDALYAELVAKYKKDDYLAVYVTPEITTTYPDIATTPYAVLYDYADVTPVTGVVNKVNHGKEAGSATGYIRSTLSTLWLNGTSKTEGTKYELNNNFTNTKALEFTGMPNAHDKGTLYLYNGRGLGWVPSTVTVPRTAMITDMRNKLDANGYVRTYVDGVYEDGTKFENLLVSDRNTRVITDTNGTRPVVFNDIYDGAVHDYNWTVGKAYFVRSYLDDQYIDNFGYNRIWFGTDHEIGENDVDKIAHFDGLDANADWDAVEYRNLPTTLHLTKNMKSIKLPTDGNVLTDGYLGYFAKNVKFIYADGTVLEGMQNVPVGTRFAVVADYVKTEKVWTISTVYVYAPYYKDYNETVFFIPSYSKDDLKDMDHDWCYDYGTTLKQAYEVINLKVYSVDGAPKTIKVYDNVDYRLYNNATAANKLCANGISAGFYQLQLMFKYNDEEIYGIIRADRNDIDGYTVAAGIPQEKSSTTGGIIYGEATGEIYETVSGGLTVVDTNDGKHTLRKLDTDEYVTFLYENHGTSTTQKHFIKSAAFIYKISDVLAYGDGLCDSKGDAKPEINDLTPNRDTETPLPTPGASIVATVTDDHYVIVAVDESKTATESERFDAAYAALKAAWPNATSIKIEQATKEATVVNNGTTYTYDIYLDGYPVYYDGKLVGAIGNQTKRSIAIYLKAAGVTPADEESCVVTYKSTGASYVYTAADVKANRVIAAGTASHISKFTSGAPALPATGYSSVDAGTTASADVVKNGKEIKVAAGATLKAGSIESGAKITIEKGGKMSANSIAANATIKVTANDKTTAGDIMDVQTDDATKVQSVVEMTTDSSKAGVTGVIGAVVKTTAGTSDKVLDTEGKPGTATVGKSDYSFAFKITDGATGENLYVIVKQKDTQVWKSNNTNTIPKSVYSQYNTMFIKFDPSNFTIKSGTFTIQVISADSKDDVETGTGTVIAAATFNVPSAG